MTIFLRENWLPAWGYYKETEPAWPNAPLRAWRWVPVLDWCSIGFAQQVKFPDLEWYAIRHYTVSFWRNWIWGIHHTYYDGPHCSIHFGFLHINWDPEWCEKCMPSCECGDSCSIDKTETPDAREGGKGE